MANPYGQQSVFCEAFLGLVTNAAPESLPEGASPLNWDVDYLVGNVFTRPGLDYVYTFTPPATNPFYYIKSYPLSDGELHTIALDSAGQLWDENVVTSPGNFTQLSPNVLAGSHAFSVTEDDVEYICFGDLSQGVDIPRQYNVHPATGAYTLDRISQVGPGAPPAFSNGTSTSGAQITITSWSGSGSTVTFQGVNTLVAGEVVVLSGFVTSTFFNGVTALVLGTGLSGTQFEISFTGFSGGTDTGIATPQFSYPIQSISQPAQHPTVDLLQSAGPGSSSAPRRIINSLTYSTPGCRYTSTLPTQ